MNERLKKIRLHFDLSQEEFGRRIGIESRAHISALENGNRNITDRIIRDVCRVYSINEDWLRTGTGGDENMLIPEDVAYMLNVGSLGSEKNEFKKFYLNMMMQLPDEYWDYIYNEFKKFENKNNEE